MLFRRLLGLIRRDRLIQDLDEELRFHTDMKAAELAAADGLSDAQARAAAQRRVGNALQWREQSREPWLFAPVETFAQDVRHTLRLLRRDPTFTLTALATLALGIGLNTAIFSVAYGVLWRPLPYHEPDRLVAVVTARNEPRGLNMFYTWTPDGYLTLRARATALLDGVAAHSGTAAQLTGQGEPRQLRGLEVTPNFFAVLGVTPALGRTFLVGPSEADDDGSVVISDRLWRAAFQANPGLVGRTITIDGLPRTVVGIMSPEFTHRPRTPFFELPDIDIWIPNRRADGGSGNAFLWVTARLKPGVEPAQAQAQLTALVNHPDASTGGSRSGGGSSNASRSDGVALVIGLHEQMVAPVRKLLLILVGAVGCVLLIACVNVANLQMARLSARRGELSIRAALGAGRRRLVRQLLTEAVVLSVAGGALGVLLADLAITLTRPFIPPGVLPRADSVSINAQVLTFCLGVTMITSLLIGLLPALRSVSARANGADGGRALYSGETRTTTDRGGERLRALLVTSQVALTLVLLVGAGLLIHSFVRLTGVPTGFDTGEVQTVTVTLPDRVYTAPQMKALARTLLERIGHLPNVESASVTNSVPFGAFFIRGDFGVEGHPPTRMWVGKPKIEPAYFKTLGIPLLQGRDFTWQDDAAAPKVAIISEAVAREFWPKGDAIGHRVRITRTDWLTVVGVVADVRHGALDGPPQPMVYTPFQQETGIFFLQTMTFMLRTRTPVSVAEGVRTEIRRAAPDLPVDSVGTLDALISRTIAEPRFRMLLLALFAVSATLIATCGIYGVMAYAVAQRRREIGVRVALGAERHDVLRLVLGRALRIIGAGIVIGLIGAFSVTRVLRSFLFDVTPGDPLAFTAVTVLLLTIGLLAAWLPARRATRIDPVAALRAE